MKTITWLLGEHYWTGLDGNQIVKVNAKGTKATYDFEDGGRVVFVGKNIEMTGGQLTSGKVSQVTFTNEHGKDFIVAEAHYKAVKLDDALLEHGGSGLREAIYGGDEFIIGSRQVDTVQGREGDDHISTRGGDDFLDGGEGNDILTGGKGSDYFQISSSDGVGRDVITDFDAKGADRDILATDLDFIKVKSVHHGEDTLLKASNGSTVLMEGVTVKEWNHYELPL
ncbi:hypothetical protein [Rhizobium sp.]